MKYFFTFFWTFVLVQMTTYVTSSMAGDAFNFGVGTIMAAIATVFIFIVTSILPSEPVEKH
ncbi:DeoR faimly transcriptional regulator [Bacillus coahuilensis p1.1.43]|uniref:DeoR faimly transcriptional regulator n=1 Tax=Bacillus coahuilensis p1.1.43 TaxID=1150625 RepID=A0A147K9Z7_9BACI|nr:YjzD family protein [Bacillus coahuilensis]KUP07506.1 DeoR faimly transcriptional regulator [Bacillus coahuilensis p1.1.43]